jgi:hypothetical protein
MDHDRCVALLAGTVSYLHMHLLVEVKHKGKKV